MNNLQEDLRNFLENTHPFSQLPSEEIAKLASKLTPFRYPMGQPIFGKEKFFHQIAIIYEGQVRLLGYDTYQKKPVTLELLQPGSVIGWLNLRRGIPCEIAIASTEVVCLILTHQEFANLVDQYPCLQQEFKDRVVLGEVFDILGSYYQEHPNSNINLRQISSKALETATVYHLPAGKYSLGNIATQPLEEKELIWFISGGGKVNNFASGDLFQFNENLKKIEVQGIYPARFLGFPKQIFNHLLEREQALLPDHVNAENNGHLKNPNSLGEIPYHPGKDLAPIIDDIDDRETGSQSQRNYPFIRANNPLDAALACFQMLSKYFKTPFRKEVIRRVLTEQIERHNNLSLPLCGAVVELMGLKAQLVKIPPEKITRVNAPILVRWQENLAIIYEIKEHQLLIAVPEVGIVKKKPSEFLKTWDDEGQLLLLQKTQETPQQKFGLSWFLPSIIKYKWTLIEVFVTSFFVQLFALANPLVIQQIIDKVIVQNSPDTLQIFGILLVGLAFFEAILGTLRTYLFVDTTNRIDMGLGSEIIDHLLRLPLRYFERRPVGEISTRINELENIRQFLTGTALTVVLDAVFSIVYIIVMIVYSPLLTVCALAVIPISIVITLVFSPIIRRQLRQKAEKNAETQSYLVEVMTGVQTVKAQNIELRSRWKWQENYARYISTSFNTVITATIASSGNNFFNHLSGLLVLWVGSYLVLQGPDVLTLGELIAFRIIAGYVTSPMLRLAQLWQNFQETALSLERLSDIVDTPQEGEEDRENIPMPLIKGAVTYENVCFRFKDNGPLQLYNVNLEFEAGTFVGLVGQSGAGKSTLVKLLSRLYNIESGRIFIDNYDIHKVELYSLRRQIGVVPQDTLLFEGTIEENIALTNPDATIEEIIEAAQIAVAHDFIMSLQNGYNTRVGERGASLSGGQRQRIAIARSVLQRPRILVLDEATSALDYITEKQVCNNLKNAFQNTTVFFITHRLDTIRDADVIVLMAQGLIAEQGTHDELMARQGRYYSLFHQQKSAGT